MQCQPLRLSLAAVLIVIAAGPIAAADSWPTGLQRVRQQADSPFLLADDGGPAAGLVLLTDSELVRNAADWLTDYVNKTADGDFQIAKAERLKPGGRCIVAAVGDKDETISRLITAGTLHIEPKVGPQGFMIQRIDSAEAGELLVCWSPGELGCRYGLIEILRSLRVDGQKVKTDLGRVVDRPQFPIRICYVNFAQHLQNAYNPNVLFDVPVNRWSRQDWEQLIDMISAFRYNVFEFWLVPTLFSPEALQGGKMQSEFAETMNHVIAYAKLRGVSACPLVTINCAGQDWRYLCPKDPSQHEQLVNLWDHWSRALQHNDYVSFFPGDPGGCTQNGCTGETYVDLCLELSKIVRKNNPDVTFEVGTWGSPFSGWGVKLWTGNPERAARSMDYFLSKLNEFPENTLTSINLGFSPDSHPTLGGDGKPYANIAAQTNRVLTWDYSVTEGEGTVLPHCRVRRIFSRRREELAAGCYSGGICYTMTPKLSCLSMFCCGEAYWNPGLEPEAVLADYGRLIFGSELAEIGPLLEEFEVVPDWGHEPPFAYSPERLEKSMNKLAGLLHTVDPTAEPRLKLAPTMAEYRKSLLFFAELFEKLGSFAAGIEEAGGLLKSAGLIPQDRSQVASLDEIKRITGESGDFDQKARVQKIVERLGQIDVTSLRKAYWDTVYGIYDAIPHPGDPRAEAATNILFKHFHGDQ